MKLGTAVADLQIQVIKESLVENFGVEGLQLKDGQPSKKLGEALNQLAKKFGDSVTLQAFNEAANMPFTGEEKAEIKKAIDQGGSPDAISALVKQKANEKDPSKRAAIAKLNEEVDPSCIDVPDELLDEITDCWDLDDAKDAIDAYLASNMSVDEVDADQLLHEVLEALDLEPCSWCGALYETMDLHDTSIGRLCDRCIAELKSRGEEIWVK